MTILGFFEREGAVFKRVRAGGVGGGATSEVHMLAADHEAAAWRASCAPVDADVPVAVVTEAAPVVEGVEETPHSEAETHD